MLITNIKDLASIKSHRISRYNKKDEVQTYLNDIEYDLVEKFIFLSRFRRLKTAFFNRQKFKSM